MLSLRSLAKMKLSSDMPDIYPPPYNIQPKTLLSRLNTPLGIFFILPLVLLSLILGNYFYIPAFDFYSLKTQSATTILEQRISNLVTTFSITLVVVGWSTTNLTTKESIPYELLFKSAKIYLIFYYLVSLIVSLFITSWLKDESWINLPNLITAITFLSIVAFGGILYSFYQFRRVILPDFLTSLLAKEAINHIKKDNKNNLILKASNVVLKDLYDKHKLVSITPPDGHNLELVVINPIPPETKSEDEILEDEILKALEHSNTKNIKLHNVYTILLAVYFKIFPPHGYSIQLQLGTIVYDNQVVFYLKKDKLSYLKSVLYAKAFHLRRFEIEEPNTKYVDYLTKYLQKNSKDGNMEQVQLALKAIDKIQEINDKISNYNP